MKSGLLILACHILALNVCYSDTTLTCPPNQTVTCLAQSTNLEAYGEAIVKVNGVEYPAGLANVSRNLNSCNVGIITRKWQVADNAQNLLECTQTITFTAGTFTEANIRWPAQDTTLRGCDNVAIPDSLPPEFRAPTWDYIQCTRIGLSFDDVDFTFGPDCRKILREWTLIDWCNFHPGQSGGVFRFTQVFKIANELPPLLTCPKDITVNADLCNSARVDLADATSSGEPCNGFYVITNNSPHADTTTQNASGTYPIGSTLVPYQLEYNCGLTLSCTTKVTVSDNIRPVPYCLATLVTALMPVDTDADGVIDDGMVEAWASDLNLNSYHPCHSGPLTFSFDTDLQEQARTFTCAEVGHNPTRIYVTDAQGRQSYCLVDINVQNNAAQIPNCEPDFSIQNIQGMLVSGKVLGADGMGLAAVQVIHRDTGTKEQMINGKATSYHNTTTGVTDADGSFYATPLEVGRNFQVQPYKVGDVSKVTDSDLQILETFIRGESTFTSAYSFIAADINEDGLVDVEDFHLMKNLIGKPESDWPNQKQWVFFSEASWYELGSAYPSLNTLRQKEMIPNLNPQNDLDLSFIGILKGDLDFYESL